MNSFKNPLTPLITLPVNIDRPIQEIQVELAKFGWLQKVFGRSWLAVKSSPGVFKSVKKKYYPQVWQGFDAEGKPMDLHEVLPNDNIKSQAFFKVNDPINVLEFVLNGNSVMRANVDIIFWFNLKRIDPDIDYPYTELLKGQVLRLLSDMLFSPDSSIEVKNIYEGALNVFKGYDISDIDDQELIYPWGGFRFETEITYREECPTNLYDVPPYLDPGPVDPEPSPIADKLILFFDLEDDTAENELIVNSVPDGENLRGEYDGSEPPSMDPGVIGNGFGTGPDANEFRTGNIGPIPEITFGFFYKPLSEDGGYILCSGNNGDCLTLFVNPDRTINIQRGDAILAVTATPISPPGVFSQIVVTMTDAEVNVYINAVLAGSHVLSQAFDANRWYLNANRQTRFGAGGVYDLIYASDEILTIDEIRTLYNFGDGLNPFL